MSVNTRVQGVAVAVDAAEIVVRPSRHHAALHRGLRASEPAERAHGTVVVRWPLSASCLGRMVASVPALRPECARCGERGARGLHLEWCVDGSRSARAWVVIEGPDGARRVTVASVDGSKIRRREAGDAVHIDVADLMALSVVRAPAPAGSGEACVELCYATTTLLARLNIPGGQVDHPVVIAG